MVPLKRIDYVVAPRVGAWIETLFVIIHPMPGKSHPVWVRGLKQGNDIKVDKAIVPVAPRVGAWIETRRATDLD